MTDAPIKADAVELSPQELQSRRELAFQLDQAIKAGLRAGREALWETAKAMYEFDESSGWSALGYDKLGDYLADPEIRMAKRTYHRMVSTYRKTVVQREIPVETISGIDMSKVDIVLSKVETGEADIEEALSDAESMGYRDLREEYWGPKEEEAPPPDPPDPDEGASAGTDEPSQNDEDVQDSGLDTVEEAIREAEGALAMPQRLGGSRQAVRGALENLIEVVRARLGD